jgi:hypothetical protein
MSGRWRPAIASRWRPAIASRWRPAVSRWRGPAIVGRWRRPSIARRWTFDIAWAHLNRPAGIANYPPCRIQDRLRGPVTVRRVKRLRIAWVNHITGRSRSKDGARDDGAAHHTGGNARSPSRASPAPSRASPTPSRTSPAPSRTSPAAAPPLGGSVRRGSQGRSDHRSCEHRDDLVFQFVSPTGARRAVLALARTEPLELDFFRQRRRERHLLKQQPRRAKANRSPLGRRYIRGRREQGAAWPFRAMQENASNGGPSSGAQLTRAPRKGPPRAR